jgi:hypothetical protein
LERVLPLQTLDLPALEAQSIWTFDLKPEAFILTTTGRTFGEAEPVSLRINWKSWRRSLRSLTIQISRPEKTSPKEPTSLKQEFRFEAFFNRNFLLIVQIYCVLIENSRKQLLFGEDKSWIIYYKENIFIVHERFYPFFCTIEL